MARQTWYDLEADKHPPSEVTQRVVAEQLNVELDWYDRLMAGEEPLTFNAPGRSDEDVATQLADLRAEVDALWQVVQRLGGARLDDDPAAGTTRAAHTRSQDPPPGRASQ